MAKEIRHHDMRDESGSMPRLDKIRQRELSRQADLEQWIKKVGTQEAARHLAHMERQIAGLRKKLVGQRKYVKQRAAYHEAELLRVPYCPHYSVCGNRPAVCLDTYTKVSEAAAKILARIPRPNADDMPKCPHLVAYVEPAFGDLRFVIDDGDDSSGTRYPNPEAAAECLREWLRQQDEGK